MALQSKTLQIEGMMCASCVAHVEKSLQGLDGVATATVNLATETAMVEFEREKVQDDDLNKAVENAGYAVAQNSTSETFEVTGMTCASCVAHVEKALKGATQIHVRKYAT